MCDGEELATLRTALEEAETRATKVHDAWAEEYLTVTYRLNEWLSRAVAERDAAQARAEAAEQRADIAIAMAEESHVYWQIAQTAEAQARAERLTQERDDWKRIVDQNLAASAETVAELERELGEGRAALGEAEQNYRQWYEVARSEEARAEQAEQNLTKYGFHRMDCEWLDPYVLPVDRRGCTCGLAAALGGQGATGEGEA